ncbi:MAG: DedA family protein [Chlamydiae bacterium]|nr:DedA family protein [Chlamydiota bacterium]
MQTLIDFIYSHAPQAHWIVFSAMILAGFNVPISEELMIITSAIIASKIIPEHTLHLFLGVFCGALIADWILYWTGRFFGDKIIHMRLFKKILYKERLDKINNFYKNYGFFTLIIGRFIPFGVRNCIFLTAGMSKMNFKKFIFGDGIACALSNSILFSTTFLLGQNISNLFAKLKIGHVLIFVLFIVTLILLFCYYKKKKNKQE